jgi:DNA (cytosine-5)-methyltransferase 1
MQVVDLFCGLGGFSAGAIASGAQVIMGVDSDPVALKMWATNVPGGCARLATLGPGSKFAPKLPMPGPHLHIHASPPCTDHKAMRGQRAEGFRKERGGEVLKWVLDLILERGDNSWSIDSVNSPDTIKILREYTEARPDKIRCETFDSAYFGAPQTRTRIITGPPNLIARLIEIPASRRVSAREALENAGMEVPALHIKNSSQNKKNGLPLMRSVEEPCYTIVASHPLTWCTRNGKTVRGLTNDESAVFMSFPDTWIIPPTARLGLRAVGSAMCVKMSTAIATAAMEIASQEPDEEEEVEVQVLDGEQVGDAPESFKAINDRLDRMERMLEEIKRQRR